MKPTSLLKGFARTVATVKPDPKKRLTIADPETKGLFLRVTPKGGKTFTVVARGPTGKQVWAAVGDAATMSVEEAREKAWEAIRNIKAGTKAVPDAVVPSSVEDVSKNFISRYVKKQGLRTAPEIERIFNKYVLPFGKPAWRTRPMDDIRRADVVALLDAVEDGSGPVMADRVFAVLSKFMNWHAVRHDDYAPPLARGMRRAKPAKERARSRILNDEEIKALWKASGEFGTFGAFLRTCLLTGQRRAKVAEMKWSDISADGIWTIPGDAREKTNAGELKLPGMVMEVIRSQQALDDNPYIFAERGKGAIKGFSAMKRRFDKAAGFDDWVIHDLRRTAKSLMSRAGVRPDISERVLGHVITGVEGVYDRHLYLDEKAKALEALAGLVALIVTQEKGGKVVHLREGIL